MNFIVNIKFTFEKKKNKYKYIKKRLTKVIKT